MKRDYQALALANSLDPKRFMKGGNKAGRVPELFAVSRPKTYRVALISDRSVRWSRHPVTCRIQLCQPRRNIGLARWWTVSSEMQTLAAMPSESMANYKAHAWITAKARGGRRGPSGRGRVSVAVVFRYAEADKGQVDIIHVRSLALLIVFVR
jgi:hypothetical protein